MKKRITVFKFGGTSVGDAAAIRRVLKIISTAATQNSLVVVVSAMSGVTNRLIEAAHQAAEGNFLSSQTLREFLRERHWKAMATLITDPGRRAPLKSALDKIIDQISHRLLEVAANRVLNPEMLDTILAAGERLSARLVATALTEHGLRAFPMDATELIVTNEKFGEAEPLLPETRGQVQRRLLPVLLNKTIPVVTGFIAAAVDGRLTTLGRGGSDLSATVLGAALDAAEVVIWTDVDGIMTADPRIVPKARILPSISYQEATELASYGAKVLHPKTLQPVRAQGIPVSIRNTFAPGKEGTRVSQNGVSLPGKVKAISALEGVSLLKIRSTADQDERSFAATIFSSTAVALPEGLILAQSSSQNVACLLVKTPRREQALAAVENGMTGLTGSFARPHVSAEMNLALIGVLGDNLRARPEITGRIFSALGRERIEVHFIAQGSSSRHLAFVVEEVQMKRAVTLLHQEFSLEKLNKETPSSEGDVVPELGARRRVGALN